MVAFLRPAPPVVETTEESGPILELILLIVLTSLLGLAALTGTQLGQSDDRQDDHEPVSRSSVLFAECGVIVGSDPTDPASPPGGFSTVVMLCAGD